MKATACKWCHQVNRHFSFQCLQRPKKQSKTYKPPKQVGKKTTKWLKVRKHWLANHPPNHQGYYTCHICGGWVKATEVTLDHVIARSKRPDLVFVESNLLPAHLQCNFEKGSKDI